MPKRTMDEEAVSVVPDKSAETTNPLNAENDSSDQPPDQKKRKPAKGVVAMQVDSDSKTDDVDASAATDSIKGSGIGRGGRGARGGGRGGGRGRGRGRGAPGPSFTDPPVSQQTPTQKMFISFRDLIDEEYARTERVYKVSRDVTKGGKDVISFLHRIPLSADSGNPPYANTSNEAVRLHLEEANRQLQEVEKMIEEITTEWTKDEHYWTLNKKYSFGLQEYIEAASYYTYLRDARLVTRSDIEQRITAANSKQTPFVLSVYDYLLGVGDLTGELMRFSINSVGQGNVVVADHVRDFIRTMHDAFSTLAEAKERELAKKTTVMKESMQKVELVCYKLRLRKAEFPDEDAAALAKYLATVDSNSGKQAEESED